MGPKDKGTKKPGKEKKEEQPKPTRTQYLSKIAEMNANLAQVKKETFLLDEIYTKTDKKYEQLKEDLDDVTKYIQYEIKDGKSVFPLVNGPGRNNIIILLSETSKVCEEEITTYDFGIEKYNKELRQQKKHYDGIFSKMDEEFEMKKRQLTEKIQSVNAKLNSFEEMRKQRGDFVERQRTFASLAKEISIRHNEEIYEAEKQAIIEQDKLQKEMENRLAQLSSNFVEATDIRIGETTNKIIGENIKLGNMLTCQQELMTKLRDDYTAMRKVHKQIALDLNLKQEECNVTFRRYSIHTRKIEELLQLSEYMTWKIEDLKKLIKINRRLKRKITELECSLKYLTEEHDALERSLEEIEDVTANAKGNLNHYRKNVLKLQLSLFEAAKKVKEAIECENNVLPAPEEVESGAERGVVTVDDTDHKELDKESMYRKRESLIEEILIKLQSEIVSTNELHVTASSTESYEINFSYRSSIDFTPISKRSETDPRIEND